MPHQCAECGEQYPDGSDEILSGCSGCGGNKFQFVPAEQPEPEEEEEEEAEPVSAGRDSQPAMSAGMASQEDDAQQDARSSMVSTDELPVNAGEDDSEETGEQTDAIEEDPASVDSVREALNQQFESIRILSPGEYELDLMKLYEREDHVISLYDDGKYAIHINDDE